MGIRIFIFLSGKLSYFFVRLCDYSDKFSKMFCISCGGMPFNRNLCHQCGQQLNLSQVSNKGESSVDKEKLLKEYSSGIPLRSHRYFAGKRHGVRMHVRMLKRELKNRLEN